jgi:hypothetical protein
MNITYGLSLLGPIIQCLPRMRDLCGQSRGRCTVLLANGVVWSVVVTGRAHRRRARCSDGTALTPVLTAWCKVLVIGAPILLEVWLEL